MVFMEKQIDLSGNAVGQGNLLDDDGVDVLKSALQKCIRRGMADSAMYFALRLCEESWFMAWKRLSVIAVEDCGQPEAILAVGELYRMFMSAKKQAKGSELTWDMKRAVACAGKILADSPKDRRADEFLELIDAFQKYGNKFGLETLKKSIEAVPDEAYDVHTKQGRMMGRGSLYWYDTSSETVNKTA